MPTRPAPSLCFLRGINVGGANIIGKDALRACFEALGFEDVRTYLQSGNVLFRATRTPARELTRMIEAELSKRFDYEARAVVFSRRTYAAAIRSAPPAWGADDDRKHNALFTLAGVTPKGVLAKLPPLRDDLETVTVARGVIFWSASIAQLSRTTMMKVARLPLYRELTVRNHRTTLKLCEMLGEV